jgi:hypothetical protein
MNSRNGVSLRPLFQVMVVLSLLLVAAIFVAACSSSMNGNVTSGMAQVKVTLSDPATCIAPNGPFSAVYVTISDVQANVSSSAGANDSGWVDLTPGLSTAPKQVELLGLSKSQCLLVTLGDSMELQAGNYQQIRMILATSSSGIAGDMCSGGGNCVVVGTGDQAQTYPLLLSSEAKTGIKIPSGQIAGGGLSISAGETRDLNIDFNTCASILREGNGQYRLKPVLTAGVVSTTSVSMNGKVVDATGAPVANAMVALEQPDPSGTKDASGNPIERIVATTTTATDGTWVICPLVQGDTSKRYDLVIIGSNASGMLSPTIVTGVSVGSTAGTVTLNAPASGLTTATNTVGTLSGQVTSVNSTSTGTPIDAALSVLETVGGVDYTVPLPATATQTNPIALIVTTAANQTPACDPGGSDCHNYTLTVPASSAYIGAWSSGSIALTTPAAPLATYIVDGVATQTGTLTLNCSPSEQFTSATGLTTTPLPPAALNLNLAFTGCQ